MITPFLFTVLREVLSARLVTLSALTLVIQRVKAVEDLEHLIEAELHSPIRYTHCLFYFHRCHYVIVEKTLGEAL